MNIGIDLDGTITDFHRYLVIYGKQFLKDYKIKNQNGYSVSDIFYINNDDEKRLNEYIRTELRMKVKPRKNAKEFLDYLHNNNYKVIIITSRKETDQIDVKNNTIKWLKDNKLYYDKLVIGNSNKAEECIKNKIDIFIDDKIKHCKSVQNEGIKTYIFNNTYNKEETLNRIYSFSELINVFNNKTF